MSDSEGDFSDELLELAGATEKKRRKRQAGKTGGSKKRKSGQSMDSDSGDMQPESEDGDVSKMNPYPLEDKYIDEADRQRLLSMNEIDREEILAQRQDEQNQIKVKHQLDQMVKDQSGRKDEGATRGTKRPHAPRGATKEKSRKLDELKAKRRAKDERKRPRTENSPKRDRSSSPMEMETESESEEDGQITKYDELEERRNSNSKGTNGTVVEDDTPITLDDLNSVRLPRDLLAKHCMAPWFEEYVKGAWVRYLIGNADGAPIYRICEVTNIGADLVKPYKVNAQTIDQTLELKHGAASKTWTMDKVSNSLFQPKEWERLLKVCEQEKVKLPSKGQVEKKKAQLMKLVTQPMTEMLARKNQFQSRQTTASLTMEKSRLNQARTLAIRRNDLSELAEIDEQLATLNAELAERNRDKEETKGNDVLAKECEVEGGGEEEEGEESCRPRLGEGWDESTAGTNFDPE
ncbi:hypothetical protein NLI96_g12382 [Meripilus lineatus]|uniref:Plus3 domain-containing protein n=1 Tax=Meripilus lineatus TaxID=2056292 RepID=A0AAD5Y7M7_9APHY|nr:hypothetical protein NLI96_g12382 [Physisporinus lineatus]